MSKAKPFTDAEREYHAKQARMNYLRQQRSVQRRMEEFAAAAERERQAAERDRAEKEAARAAEQQARAAAERERAQKEAALDEVERLRRLLDAQQRGA